MTLSAPIYRLKRQAKMMARAEGVALHEAQARVARAEGFASWSLLAAHHDAGAPARRMLGQLTPGDLVLLAARPGHGKTALALEVLAAALRAGRRGWFFTLEYTLREAAELMAERGVDLHAAQTALRVDVSDDICADRIIAATTDAPRGAVVVVDYLQLLDQKRGTPPLDAQVTQLKTHVAGRGLILLMISQIHRTFDPAEKPIPDLADIRLPNPLDLDQFTKTCFLHDGALRF